MSAAIAINNPRQFVASKLQADFFAWVSRGRGNAILKAVAGSGKSTSIVRSLQGIPETATVIILAFNSPIAKEMKEKVVALGVEVGRDFRNVEACTFHSRGFRALTKHLGGDAKIEVDAGKVRKILKDRLSEAEYDLYGDFVAKLVGIAKGMGIAIPGMTPDVEQAWSGIIASQDMWLDSEDATEERAIEIARKALAASSAKAAKDRWIDFDDQLYLPLLWNLRFYGHDWVFVDEAQDTNPVRREIACRLLKRGGRFVAVGDPRQAIYGFCHIPGELVMTPNGYTAIEKLKKGDAVITSNCSGEIAGWAGNRRILETHKFYHSGNILTINVDGRKTTVTPHHRVPVKIDDDIAYYTYIMRRCGVYRVGYCKAYTSSSFMLAHRRRIEKADCAWILGAHKTKDEARKAEKALLKRVKGTTLHALNDAAVVKLPTDETEALKVLAEHGRMADFPLITSDGRQPRISKTGAFITEACNLIDGMKAAFYSDEQIDKRKRGRGQQAFVWSPITISTQHYSGFVYGITVPSSHNYAHGAYRAKGVSLYFAGNILVHNTGASHDAMDLIAEQFETVELPLTVSYRCSRAAGEMARSIVPYFEVAPNAVEGEVLGVNLKQGLERLGAGDMILCRKTAPLIDLAFKLIGEGRGCLVLGKEIGAGLENLIKKMRAGGIDVLLDKLEMYLEREGKKFDKKGEAAKKESLEDRIAAINVVAASLHEPDRTVPKLLSKIGELFADGSGAGLLTLSTIHKAKGREANNVGLYMPELCPSKAAKTQEAFQQEMNLIYVAYTRTMNGLYLIEGERRS